MEAPSERTLLLRQELKLWEQAFALAHNGRKAGRDDIKKDPAIAAKYKEYTRARERGAVAEPDSNKNASKPELVSNERPGKKRKAAESRQECQTPVKRTKAITPRKAEAPLLDTYDSPSALRVLLNTPTRRSVIGPTPQKDGKILGLFDALDENPPSATPTHKITLTPRKEISQQSRNQADRTPSSNGKRLFGDKVKTPVRGRAGGSTPLRSASKVLFETPAFLRRCNQPASNLETLAEETSSRPFPVKPIRGLSSMLASLRKMEDDKLDEELDILRETEGNVAEAGEEAAAEKVAVPRQWKKKGQKRTTRRFTLKPVQMRPKKAVQEDEANDQDDTGSDQGTKADHDLIAHEMMRTRKEAAKRQGEPEEQEAKEEGRARKKIKATTLARTNFRRLKIRSFGKGRRGR